MRSKFQLFSLEIYKYNRHHLWFNEGFPNSTNFDTWFYFLDAWAGVTWKTESNYCLINLFSYVLYLLYVIYVFKRFYRA